MDGQENYAIPGNGGQTPITQTTSIQGIPGMVPLWVDASQGAELGEGAIHKGLGLILLLVGFALGGLAFMGLSLWAGLFSKSG